MGDPPSKATAKGDEIPTHRGSSHTPTLVFREIQRGPFLDEVDRLRAVATRV